MEPPACANSTQKAEHQLLKNAPKLALHHSAQLGHADLVSRLLSAGAPVNVPNSKGRTPLHLAAISGHDLVIYFLVRAGAEVNAKDHKLRTALHYACWYGHENVVRRLLHAGADAAVLDFCGCMPFQVLPKFVDNRVPECVIQTPEQPKRRIFRLLFRHGTEHPNLRNANNSHPNLPDVPVLLSPTALPYSQSKPLTPHSPMAKQILPSPTSTRATQTSGGAVPWVATQKARPVSMSTTSDANAAHPNRLSQNFGTVRRNVQIPSHNLVMRAGVCLHEDLFDSLMGGLSLRGTIATRSARLHPCLSNSQDFIYLPVPPSKYDIELSSLSPTISRQFTKTPAKARAKPEYQPAKAKRTSLLLSRTTTLPTALKEITFLQAVAELALDAPDDDPFQTLAEFVPSLIGIVQLGTHLWFAMEDPFPICRQTTKEVAPSDSPHMESAHNTITTTPSCICLRFNPKALYPCVVTNVCVQANFQTGSPKLVLGPDCWSKSGEDLHLALLRFLTPTNSRLNKQIANQLKTSLASLSTAVKQLRCYLCPGPCTLALWYDPGSSRSGLTLLNLGESFVVDEEDVSAPTPLPPPDFLPLDCDQWCNCLQLVIDELRKLAQ